MCLKRVLFVLIFLFFTRQAFTQERFTYNSTVEKNFSEAIEEYRSGHYIEALGMFEILLKQKPLHQRSTASYIMAGKDLQSLKKYRESSMLLNDFIQSFPQSNYLDDAHYTLAINYMFLRNEEDAIKHLIKTMEISKDRHLKSEAESLFDEIVNENTDNNFLQTLKSKANNNEIRNLLSLKLAKNYFASGIPKRAEAQLDEIINSIPKSKYEAYATKLKEKIAGKVNVKIGILLPLLRKYPSSSVKTISEEILDGITFAADEYKSFHSALNSVSLEVMDSERDLKIAANAFDDLADNKDVIAVIGPLFSNIAVECAKVAERNKIPMITPTATSNGIASIGSYIFQASPDIETHGKILARYAVHQLGFTRLAILASSEPVGKSLAESFRKEVEKLGAHVVAHEFYADGESDLSEQFYSIRRAGFKNQNKKDDSHNTEVPLTGIEGLFIPISDADEIGIISSQLKYFNIETQILGSDEWYDTQQLESNKRYLNKLLFMSDTYVDENDARYLVFNKSFSQKMKKLPSKYTIIGYDVMELLLTKIAAGVTTREGMKSALNNTRANDGIHSKVTFGKSRVNSELQILQFINGEIKKVDEISLK